MRWPGRRGRVAAAVAAGAAAAVLLVNVALLAAVPVARAAGGGVDDVEIAGADKVRRVDDRLWAGAQPDPGGYRRLADAGVVLVIDLRTGASDDPVLADADLLGELGLAYRRLPLPDGHAPDRRTVGRFVRAVETAGGLVYLHCGAGVGRSTSLQAAWLAHTGRRLAVPDALSMGPLTLDQLWFVARRRPGRPAGGNPVVRRVSEVVDAPRRLWSRARAAAG